MNKTKFPIFTAAALALLPIGLSAQTTIAWDATVLTGDFTTDSNWIGGVAPANDTTTNIAQLTGGTVTLDATRSVNGLDLFAASTLTGTGTTLTAVSLTGSEDLTLSGTTTLDLNTDNAALNYTGDITIGTGASIVADRNAIKLDTATYANTTITLDGGTVSASGNHIDVAGRNFVLTANGGTLQHSHARNMYGFGGTAGNLISGVGQLTISGGGSTSTAGRMQLDSVNTYTGGTRVENGGQAWLYNDNSLGADNTSVTLTTGGTLYMVANRNLGDRALILEGSGRFNLNGKTLTIGGGSVLSGAGDLTITNGGHVNLNSAGNTYTGGTTISGGSQVNLYNAAADALGTGDITLDDGKIKNRENRPTINNNIILAEGGGELIAGWTNRNMTANGVISGTGALTIGDDSSAVIITNGANTYSGGTTINGFAMVSGTLGTGSITLDDIVGGRGKIQNNDSNTILNNDLIVSNANNGGRLKAGWGKKLEITGVVSGAGGMVIEGDSGTVIWSNAANTYSGAINLQDATSKFSAASLGAGASVTGDAGSTFTATGSSAFDAASGFTGTTIVEGFSIGTETITAGMTVTFSSTSEMAFGDLLTVDSGATIGFDGFGVGNITGISSATAVGTYLMIDGDGTILTAGLNNFGSGEAFDLGGGKTAYFESGSLNLIVVPEPSSFGLIAGALALGSVMIRRRRS